MSKKIKDLTDLDDVVIDKAKFGWMALREWQKFATGFIAGMGFLAAIIKWL